MGAMNILYNDYIIENWQLFVSIFIEKRQLFVCFSVFGIHIIVLIKLLE